MIDTKIKETVGLIKRKKSMDKLYEPKILMYHLNTQLHNI
jgi:hypothetical protein